MKDKLTERNRKTPRFSSGGSVRVKLLCYRDEFCKSTPSTHTTHTDRRVRVTWCSAMEEKLHFLRKVTKKRKSLGLLRHLAAICLLDSGNDVFYF